MKGEKIVISSRIEREKYSELLNYCKNQNVIPSKLIKNLIEKVLHEKIPIHKAGINKIDFNKEKNCFSWKILYDDGSFKIISENLSDSFLENLRKSIDSALSLRNEYIHKRIKESVVSPVGIPKLEGRGENVKG